MASIHAGAARQVIAKHIVNNTRNIPVVSNVRCVRLYRRKYGFGLNFRYLYRTNSIMEDPESREYENLADEYEDDISGSDADISGESSDTSSNKDVDDTVDKLFIKSLAPGGPADQAGLMKGDEVISLNNSAVYGKHASEIDSLMQHSHAIDVDVIEDPAKRKGTEFQRYRGNGYEVHVVHRGSQDDLSDRELSNNESHSTSTRSRYFVVTYGKASESTANKSKIRPFLRPTSYSDDEPLMENKSVSISVANSEDGTRRTRAGRYQDNTFSRGSNIPAKKSGLTSSTSSSVLVESRDPKPDIPVTIATATFCTLAEPKSILSHDNTETKENTSSSNRLFVTQENGNVWELRVPRGTHIRPRSPSPANRRVSYLMATEHDGSLSPENWEFKPITNGDPSYDGLSPCEEENGFQNKSEDERDRTSLHILSGENLEDDEDANNIEEVVDEEKRHSLKRKCSADSVEVAKEGYLKRKFGATHGRRPWKQVYVVLKEHIMYIYKEKPDQMILSGQDDKPISIKSCIVDIAYDYRKRENVFKLTTYNGSQYLFQAKDKDDMMSWIEVIQKNNNPDEDTLGCTSEDLIVRQKKNMDVEISSQTNKALPPTSLKIGGLKKSLSLRNNSGSQPSFKIKKAIEGEGSKPTWHSKVVNKVKRIGNPTNNPIPQYQTTQGYSATSSLEHCPKSKNNLYLPLLVEHCCNVVENRALESVGIYRVPGNSAMVTALEEELNAKTPDDINFDEPKWNDANNMGSLLRNFLRKLPEGLVTSELYGRFIDANRIEGDERMWSLKSLIRQLPHAFGETMKFIIRHLKKVSEHSDKNKMEVRNLAIVFGPTIVRTGEDNMTTMVNDMSDRFRIVESFINNFDWFFDNEHVTGGDRISSPSSPPPEVTSPLLVSSNAMNSIEQAAVNYESGTPWKSKGGSIKLPTFRNFRRTQSSDSSKSSESSKKQDISPQPSPEPMDGKISPVHLSLRFGGSSQPSSPSTGRRKFMKRHHSSTNISMTDVHDDFDRSKSEGEEDEHTFYPRPSHPTKAYSYARPPPPSYRESRNKARAPIVSNTQIPSNKDLTPDTGDFNSLSDETKRRLLRVTLRNKVNEKKKQQSEASSPPTTPKTVSETFQRDFVNVIIPRKLSNGPQVVDSTMDEQKVVTEPQLSPYEVRQRPEQRSDETKTATASEASALKTFSSEAVRRRDGSASCSSSRNFKIYSKGDVTFSHCQPHQINEWMRDLGLSPKGGNDRGRARAKTEDLSKTLRRCSSVSRTSFTQEEVVVKRRSLSCQDINTGDEDYLNRQRTLSNSSDSSQSSDDEEDPIEASSKAFDEKLRGLMQKCKLESKSKTELQHSRKSSQVSRPPSYRVNRTPVEKMKDIDPSSNIPTGAVTSIKSLFESGAVNQQVVKSRSSSLSSASSGSVLSCDTHRKSTSSTLSDADVKRRVWESGEGKPGEGKKQWKEAEWIARERAMKNLCSESVSSLKEPPDKNNNLPKERGSTIQYSRSTSLPTRDGCYLVKGVSVERFDVTVEQTKPEVKANIVRRFPTEKMTGPVESPILQRAAVKNGPVIRRVTPVQYLGDGSESVSTQEAQPKNQAGSRVGSLTSVQYKINSERDSAPTLSVKCEANSSVQSVCPHKVVVGPTRSTLSSQECSPPVSPPVLNSPARSASPNSPSLCNSAEKRPSARPRRRIVSDTSHHAHPETRQAGRTFTAPILGTIVTTTNAIELSGFAIKPENINRNPKARVTRRSERQNSLGSLGGQRRILNDMKASSSNLPRPTLTIPANPSPSDYGSPSIRRKAGLTVPEIDDSRRLSTDRTLLEQNALHIKELLEEMNTEHTLKMERQKSDTISMEAQKAAKNKAKMRRHSLGQDRDNGVIVASRICPSEVLNERNRSESQKSRSNDIPRNISTVEWVGVSS